LALSDWALLIRFDDGSVVELVSPAGPEQMRARPDELRPRRAEPRPILPRRSLKGRVGDTLHGVGLAARRLAAGEY
jgi:hypothetical protein